MVDDIFPIKIRASGQCGGGAYGYRGLFLSGKPEGRSWFAYDTNILSETTIEFIAYEMKDSFSGGIGREAFRFTVAAQKDQTRYDVEQRIKALAATRFYTERAAREDEAIGKIADEIRASLLAKHGGAA